MSESRSAKKTKRPIQGMPISVFEEQLKRLAAVTIYLLEKGYRPRGIETGGAWLYEDGSVHAIGFIVVDVTNWHRKEMTAWMDMIAGQDWNFTVDSEDERAVMRVFIDGP